MLSLILLSALEAKAATWFYSCYEIGDSTNFLPKSFVLEQNNENIVLKPFVYNKDISLDLTGMSKGKAFYELETNKYFTSVKADGILRTGGFKAQDGSYVGTIEVTYDDYREEYFQAYFCKRKVTFKKP